MAWDSPLEGDESSLSVDPEPLYAVPHKEHRFNFEDFILHKMLGKGSFGKVKIIFTSQLMEKALNSNGKNSSVMLRALTLTPLNSSVF